LGVKVRIFRFYVLFCIIIGEVLVVLGKLSKLTLEQHFLNFILYMKHDNVIMYVAFMWNCSKFALCHDTIFIASCVNYALEDEIQWSTLEERLSLGMHLQEIS
jgi:hypothetical protein